MGNKTTPIAFRLGITQKHHADWCVAKKKVPIYLLQDMQARAYLIKKFSNSAVISKISISRSQESVEITIKCLKPSVLVGKKGGEINIVVSDLTKIYGVEVKIKIFDVKRPEIDAYCIGREVANELMKRGVSCKRVMKKVVQNAIRVGALGARVECSGRLAGVEIARTESYQEKALPRHKLRANIAYAAVNSYTAWGVCGVKVWVYLGDYVKRVDKFSDKISIHSNRNETSGQKSESKRERAFDKKHDNVIRAEK